MFNKKGIALLAVLVTLLVVVALANIIMNIILSQSRLTHHKVSRIQAYYAATAGVSFALDRLIHRDGNWIPNPVVSHYMCQNALVPQCAGDTAPIIEPRLPGAIQFVIVRVALRGAAINNPVNGAPWPVCDPPAGINNCVNAQSVYTYQ